MWQGLEEREKALMNNTAFFASGERFKKKNERARAWLANSDFKVQDS